MTLEEIKQDMYKYAKNFPTDYIPHVRMDDTIND
jgi:hypothetical protein